MNSRSTSDAFRFSARQAPWNASRSSLPTRIRRPTSLLDITADYCMDTHLCIQKVSRPCRVNPDFAVAAFPALLGRHPCCGDRHRSGPMERRRHHDAGGRFLAARARQCRGDRAMRRGRAHGRFRSAMHHHRESAGSTGAVGLWGDTSYFGRFSSASTGPAAIATRRAAIRLRSCSGSGRDDSAS